MVSHLATWLSGGQPDSQNGQSSPETARRAANAWSSVLCVLEGALVQHLPAVSAQRAPASSCLLTPLLPSFLFSVVLGSQTQGLSLNYILALSQSYWYNGGSLPAAPFLSRPMHNCANTIG